jgi:CRISPR-associated protein Csm4
MPELSCFIIKPNAPFHIGERGVGLEETSTTVHSDTLFGAICWAWRLLYGEDELIEMLDLFQHDRPPFLISSTFPFMGEIKTLPKPLHGLGLEGQEKSVRRAPLVTYSIFQNLAQGKSLQAQDYKIVRGDPGNIIASRDEASAIQDMLSKAGVTIPWTVGEASRVTLDRDTRRSDIYYAGDVRFVKDCGLYMLVDFLDEEYEPRLEGAMRLLGDEGLGGERSSGRGLFSLDHGSISLGSDGGDKAMLLSLCRPRKEETTILPKSFYGLISRRGWVAGKSDRRKRSVRMLIEGSVIPSKPENLIGCMEDVGGEGTRKGKRILSYGLAFKAPMKVAE